MMKLLWLTTLVYLVGAQAFADVTYTPDGTQIGLQAAVQAVVAGGNATYTAFQDELFIIFAPKDAPATWAMTKSLDDVKYFVHKYEKLKYLRVGNVSYTLGFNRLESSFGGAIYDFTTQLQDAMAAAKTMDPPKTQDDIADTIQDFYGGTYTLTSIFGGNVTYQEVSGGMGGGAAHDWEVNSLVSHDEIGQAGSILPFVDNTSLLNALKRDSYIIKVATKAGKLQQLGKITQLTEFAEYAKDLFFNAEDQPVGWTFEPMAQFSKFAVYDYDPKTQLVSIRLGLEAQYGYSRGEMSQLGLKVKASAQGAPLFARAKAGDGILWVDAKKKLN
jgi:hypothetical protein